MKQVSIEEVEADLSGYLQQAEKDYVIITRKGAPVGIIIGLEDPEDWWEELLLHNPKFLERIARARKHLQEGKGVKQFKIQNSEFKIGKVPQNKDLGGSAYAI